MTVINGTAIFSLVHYFTTLHVKFEAHLRRVIAVIMTAEARRNTVILLHCRKIVHDLVEVDNMHRHYLTAFGKCCDKVIVNLC